MLINGLQCAHFAPHSSEHLPDGNLAGVTVPAGFGKALVITVDRIAKSRDPERPGGFSEPIARSTAHLDVRFTPLDGNNRSWLGKTSAEQIRPDCARFGKEVVTEMTEVGVVVGPSFVEQHSSPNAARSLDPGQRKRHGPAVIAISRVACRSGQGAPGPEGFSRTAGENRVHRERGGENSERQPKATQPRDLRFLRSDAGAMRASMPSRCRR